MATKFIRNSMFGVLAGASTTLGNFAAGLLVARLSGIEAFGTVAFMIWLANLTVTVAVAGIPFTIGRYLPELTASGEAKQGENLVGYLFRPFVVFVAIPTAAYLLYGLWLKLDTASFENGGGHSTLLSSVAIVLIGVNVMGQALAEYVRGYLRGTQQFDRLAKITIVAVVFQLAIIALAGHFFGADGAFFGYLVGNGLPAIWLWKINLGRAKISAELKGRIVRYAGFRWASDLLAFILWSRIELLFLQIWWGNEAVGLFAISLTLANLATQGPLMLTWGLLPRFSEQFGNRQHDRMQEAFGTATRIMGFMVLPACFGLAAVMPQALTLLYGHAASAAAPAAMVIVCAAAIPATATIAANLVWAMDRSDIDLYTGSVGAILTIIAGVTFVPIFGLMGAACIRAVVSVVVIWMGCWFITRRLHIQIPFARLSRLLAAAICCAISAKGVLLLIPALYGLPLAIGVGALVYVFAVGWFRALPPADIAKLGMITAHLPPPASQLFSLAARAMAP